MVRLISFAAFLPLLFVLQLLEAFFPTSCLLSGRMFLTSQDIFVLHHNISNTFGSWFDLSDRHILDTVSSRKVG